MDTQSVELSPSERNTLTLGDLPSKLTNSNEKLEQRYKEIIKENDGKLFEVHQKKGQVMSNSSVIRQLTS